MSIQYFLWGQAAGGTSPSGPTAPPAASYGPPEQFEGNAGLLGDTVTFTRATKWVHVINVDDEFALEVSFDGGATYIIIGSGGDLKEFVQVSSLEVRGVGGVAAYQISAGLTAA